METNSKSSMQALRKECSCNKEATNTDEIFATLDMTLEFMLAGGPCQRSRSLETKSHTITIPNRPPRQTLRNGSLIDEFESSEFDTEDSNPDGLQTLGEETNL